MPNLADGPKLCEMDGLVEFRDFVDALSARSDRFEILG